MMHNLIKFNFHFNCFVSHGYYYSNVVENLSLLFCPEKLSNWKDEGGKGLVT